MAKMQDAANEMLKATAAESDQGQMLNTLITILDGTLRPGSGAASPPGPDGIEVVGCAYSRRTP